MQDADMSFVDCDTKILPALSDDEGEHFPHDEAGDSANEASRTGSEAAPVFGVEILRRPTYARRSVDDAYKSSGALG